MTTSPEAAVVTLGLPGIEPTVEAAWAEAAYDGLAALAARYSVAVVGGETTRNPYSSASCSMRPVNRSDLTRIALPPISAGSCGTNFKNNHRSRHTAAILPMEVRGAPVL